ncbi:Fanconi anemia core complex-associated protein 20 [Tachyglossus aculeatus]|uniref:Fanconi anemia core complex-associated protein 20 n=1 Tax=Tachyglossus aculeatus TaxID=9261 RepID=UPI0018F64596|nr:Fanconi anemia core complex-associated protein 20 [Tachyglossus aculeatus]
MPFPPAPEFGRKAKYPQSPRRSGSGRKQLTRRLRREPSRGERNSSAEAVGSKSGALSPPERAGTFKAERLQAFPKVDSPRPSKKHRGLELGPLPVTRSLPERSPAVGNGQGEGCRGTPGWEKSESGVGLDDAGLTSSPQAAGSGTNIEEPMAGTKTLESCPMCQIPFGPTLSQSDVDGHLAQCLSESTEDVIW